MLFWCPPPPSSWQTSCADTLASLMCTGLKIQSIGMLAALWAPPATSPRRSLRFNMNPILNSAGQQRSQGQIWKVKISNLQQKIVWWRFWTNRVHHLRSHFPVSEVFPRWLCTDDNTVITCKDLTQHLLRRCKESWPKERGDAKFKY